MQILDGQPVYSASDLTSFLECRHKVGLDMAAAHHRATGSGASAGSKAATADEVDIVQRHGLAHEKRYLERLKAEGRDVAEIPELTGQRDRAAIEAAAASTIEFMRAGREVIFQAVLFDGTWLGYADFLMRVNQPSDLGDHSYEAHDTKLARSTKVSALIQLTEYSAHLERIQGLAPVDMHVVLGDESVESVPVANVAAYHRRLRQRFFEAVQEDLTLVYPVPVSHCQVCNYAEACGQRRIDDDHLSLLPGARRDQVGKLEAAGLGTVVDLGTAVPPIEVPRLAAETAAQLQSLARLQVEARADGIPKTEAKPRTEDSTRLGFDLLPEPDDGDLFFDLEGDPFIGDRGREYLWGWCDVAGDDGYVSRWGHEPQAERAAAEFFIDLVADRLKAHPGMHVYHYAAYEITVLKRLCSLHGTRENELDDLLRGQVFVDLYTITRQALLVSVPSYSIKDLEAYYRPKRKTGVQSGMASVVAYEDWLETGEQSLLDDIEAYNKDDCVSTLELRDWLLALRPDSSYVAPKVEDKAEPEGPSDAQLRDARRDALVDRLMGSAS